MLLHCFQYLGAMVIYMKIAVLFSRRIHEDCEVISDPVILEGAIDERKETELWLASMMVGSELQVLANHGHQTS
jgi:hypothetical protein